MDDLPKTTSGAPTGAVIAGAGPTGLLLACELARRGVPFRLVERESEPFRGARGKGLQPRTLEVLEDVGVIAGVLAHGGAYPPMRAYQGGELIWEGRMDEPRTPTPDVPYPNAWMLPQWRTGELLRRRLAELGGAVEWGVEVTGLTQGEGVAGGLTVTLRHASTGVPAREETVRAEYLVAADGGRSTVRRLLGVGFAGETREQERSLVADVRLTGLDRDFWHIWPNTTSGPAAFPLMLCPLAGTDAFQLMLPLEPDQPAPPAELAPLQAVLDAAAGPGRVRLEELLWASEFRANIRMAERFRIGRVLLAGDAAHVHSPAGGQGLNTGLGDAYNLGWKLAAVLCGASETLLDSYEAERLPIAAGVLGISTALHDKGRAGAADAMRRDDPELHQLQLGYPESPLSRELRGAPGAVRAGNRLPDAPGETTGGAPLRLFTVLRRPDWALLAVGAAAAGLAATLPAQPGLARVGVLPPGAVDDATAAEAAGLHVFVDAEAHARTALDTAPAGALLLVRPDGYVALAADAEPEGLLQALAHLRQFLPTGTTHGVGHLRGAACGEAVG